MAVAMTCGLRVVIAAVSQMDDIYTYQCNGDTIGIECPADDWEPGETSGLTDAVKSAGEHLAEHARHAEGK